jgi:hypothetical protein
MLLQKLGSLQNSGPHWVLAGSLLQSLVSEELAVIAEESLLNKVFPSKKEYHNQLRQGLQFWTKRNGLPSMPNSRDVGPVPKTLDRAFKTGHVPYYQILHQPIPKNL